LKDGRDIMQFGSQGQKRTAALALRIAQFHHLKQKLKITPLLLIDDVIRELDTMRRSAFVKLLRESGQAIFTTPDLDGIDEDLKSLVSQSSVIHILGDGRVEQSVG
jgi:DNA replication and repair protein RecF